jgi:hypothetical protein
MKLSDNKPRIYSTGVPSEEELSSRDTGDLRDWVRNCRNKLQTYLEKEPFTEFWQGLAELMEKKVTAIEEHLKNRPVTPVSLPPPKKRTWSDSNAKNPFSPNKSDLGRLPNDSAWGRGGCPYVPGENPQPWKKMKTEEEKKKKRMEKGWLTVEEWQTIYKEKGHVFSPPKREEDERHPSETPKETTWYDQVGRNPGTPPSEEEKDELLID